MSGGVGGGRKPPYPDSMESVAITLTGDKLLPNRIQLPL